MYIACISGILYPVSVQKAKTAQQENKIVGKKATPPKRGMARLCNFRSSGISNSFLRKEIIKIWGMMKRATLAEMANAKITNTKCILI